MMKFTFKTKLLAVLMAALILATLVPAFFSVAYAASTASTDDWGLMDENADGTIDALSAESGNLARMDGVQISYQHTPHSDSNWGWDASLINDGTLNRIASTGTNGGYHPNTGVIQQNHSEWIVFNLGELKTVDTVVFYPCLEQDGVCYGMPNAYAIEVSTNGTDWKRVYEVYDVAIPEFGPQIAQFEEETVQYVRLNMLSLNLSSGNTFAAKICEVAIFDKDYVKVAEPYCPNLAEGKPTTHVNALTGNSSWLTSNINDGDRYNLYTADLNNHGQFGGWHSSGSSTAAITIDLEEVTEIDQIVIWPSTEKYCTNAQKGNSTKSDSWGLYLPDGLTISVSKDNVTWTTVKEVSSLTLAEYAPITYDIDLTEAQYVKFSMTASGYVKLSEIEIYNTNLTITPEDSNSVVTVSNVNHALKATTIYSSITTNAGSWDYSFLNNDILEFEGGFTTGVSDTAWVGYEFNNLTTLNKLVLYPSASTEAADAEWCGIPKTFRVEYSTDGLAWNLLTTGSAAPDPDSQTPVVITFVPTAVKMIRIWSDDIYPKPSDQGGAKRIQLAEMEAWYDPSILTSGDALFAPFYQVKENADTSKHDLRVVLVTNLEKLKTIDEATVTITFNLTDGSTKSSIKKLDGTKGNYSVYKTINAADDTYTAADGFAIFGSVITDIPDGAYSSFSIVIVDGNGTTLLDVTSQ